MEDKKGLAEEPSVQNAEKERHPEEQTTPRQEHMKEKKAKEKKTHGDFGLYSKGEVDDIVKMLLAVEGKNKGKRKGQSSSSQEKLPVTPAACDYDIDEMIDICKAIQMSQEQRGDKPSTGGSLGQPPKIAYVGQVLPSGKIEFTKLEDDPEVETPAASSEAESKDFKKAMHTIKKKKNHG